MTAPHDRGRDPTSTMRLAPAEERASASAAAAVAQIRGRPLLGHRSQMVLGPTTRLVICVLDRTPAA